MLNNLIGLAGVMLSLLAFVALARLVRLQGDGRLLVRRNSGRDKMEEIK